jgi:hypothetical protein
LFRLSRNDWRVEKDELERWAAGQWTNCEQAWLRADAVRRVIRKRPTACSCRGLLAS